MVKWDSNDTSWTEFSFDIIDKKTKTRIINKTQGVGFGYYIRTNSSDGQRVYTHINPNAKSTQAWSSILRENNRLTEKYGGNLVPPVTLPPNVQIGEVGLTGNMTGSYLHYEGPEKVPQKPKPAPVKVPNGNIKEAY